jgi:hypothetical protein
MPPSDPIPSCAANASATMDEAVARAWEFAPVVHFHQLEETPLQVSYFLYKFLSLLVKCRGVVHHICAITLKG